MPQFSKASLGKLSTCHLDLQRLMHAVIKRTDITILCGHRGEKEQNEAFRKGNSKLKFPKSKHNSRPSRAVDIAPHPIDWNNHQRFRDAAKIVLEEAKKLNISVRWGGDWDGDGQTSDEKFVDMPHFELI